MPGSSAGVGVVVVTYSPGPTLDAFLDTLDKATTRPAGVVLADNGSTDGVPERAAERPGVELVRTGGNLGYGRAANVGVPHAPGDWVVVANPDLRWEPGALDTMLGKIAEFYEEEVDTAVAGMLTLLEPIMIAFLGTIVGGIVIAMYMPIFDLISKLT